MDEALRQLNSLPPAEATAELLKCCGSTRWAREMCGRRPFLDSRELTEAADRVWLGLSREDWLEAFRSHPKIGGRGAERETGERARRWSEEEQKGTRGAAPDVLEELAEANREYEQRFGHIFIVCATGKSAAEMLALLRRRLGNDPEAELRVAAEEQRRITRLRLEKLLGASHGSQSGSRDEGRNGSPSGS
jgi:OHCU decarboxylase